MQIKLELFEGKQKLASFSGQVPNGYKVFRIMSELLTTTLLNDITECISGDKDTSTSYEDDTPKVHQTLKSEDTPPKDIVEEVKEAKEVKGVKEVKEVKEAGEVGEAGEAGEVGEAGKEGEEVVEVAEIDRNNKEVEPVNAEKLVHTNPTLPKVGLDAKVEIVSQEIEQKGTSSKVDTSKTIMLFMKCNKCHAIKCYKTQQGTTAHCSCGEEYPTDELVRISAVCPNCGRSIGFMTAKGMDVSDGLICKWCGSPVDLEFNRKRNCWQSLNY